MEKIYKTEHLLDHLDLQHDRIEPAVDSFRIANLFVYFLNLETYLRHLSCTLLSLCHLDSDIDEWDLKFLGWDLIIKGTPSFFGFYINNSYNIFNNKSNYLNIDKFQYVCLFGRHSQKHKL